MIRRNKVIDLLKKKQGERTQKDFAGELGIDPSVLSLIYSHRVLPNEEALKAIGYRRVELYEQIRASSKHHESVQERG